MEDESELAHIKEIQVALISLMMRGPYQSIRVHHIAEQAGISRNTFYRCFKNKDQVISAIYDQAMGNSLMTVDAELESINTTQNPQNDVVFEIVFQIFSATEQQRHIAKILFNADVDELIYSRFSLFFSRLCGKLIRRKNLHVSKDRMIEFLLSHMKGSAFHFFKEWILYDAPPTAEKMAHLYTRILRPSLELMSELTEKKS